MIFNEISEYQPLIDNTSGPIVMVDDNATDTIIATRCFKITGLSNAFISFQSPSLFFDYIDAVSRMEKTMPSVLLLDINMPEMNGFQVLEHLRSLDPFKQVPPVIMFSNSCDYADWDLARSLGANGFQTKLANASDYQKFYQNLFTNQFAA